MPYFSSDQVLSILVLFDWRTFPSLTRLSVPFGKFGHPDTRPHSSPLIIAVPSPRHESSLWPSEAKKSGCAALSLIELQQNNNGSADGNQRRAARRHRAAWQGPVIRNSASVMFSPSWSHCALAGCRRRAQVGSKTSVSTHARALYSAIVAVMCPQIHVQVHRSHDVIQSSGTSPKFVIFNGLRSYADEFSFSAGRRSSKPHQGSFLALQLIIPFTRF